MTVVSGSLINAASPAAIYTAPAGALCPGGHPIVIIFCQIILQLVFCAPDMVY